MERGHKCPPQIPLHIMEEVWEIINPEEQQDNEDLSDSEEELLTLSQSANTRISGKKTMRLKGLLNN